MKRKEKGMGVGKMPESRRKRVVSLVAALTALMGMMSANGGIDRGFFDGLLRIPSRCGDEPQLVRVVDYTRAWLTAHGVWSVVEDKWHRMWMGLLGGGIQMLDLKTGKFRTWDQSNTPLPSNYMTSACWTKKGWLMMGTSYYYCLLNPVTGRLINQVFPGSENLDLRPEDAVSEDLRYDQRPLRLQRVLHY